MEEKMAQGERNTMNDLVSKYIKEETLAESKVYKSFVDRIKRAASAKDITKVLSDIQKAVKQDEISQREALKLADMADDALEDV